MPTVAISSQISEAVYLIAVLALAALLARPVYAVYSASQERGAEAVASGLSEMIDRLEPGTIVVAKVESFPGTGLSVALQGTSVTASFEGTSATAQVRWELPHEKLVPGEDYSFTVRGDKVEVAARDG